MTDHDGLYVENMGGPHAYRHLHHLIRKERGKASAHQCSAPGCDRQALNWAWMKTGPWTSGVHAGNQVSWGLDISTYAPMCARDAARMDSGGSLTRCPNGHERTPENTYEYPNGRQLCRTCKADGQKGPRPQRGRKPCPHCGKQITEQNLSAHVRRMHPEGETR